MKNTRLLRCAITVLAFSVIGTGCATTRPGRLMGFDAIASPGDKQFHIRDGQLMRGKSAFTIHAIASPYMAEPGAPYSLVGAAVNDCAAVGANSVCVDLYGYGAGDTLISEEGFAALRETANQIDLRRLATICRIFGENAPQGMRYREAAIRHAAEKFKEQTDLIYWVDGPNAAALAALFSDLAPRLVVAAENGGVMQIVRSPQAAREQPLAILANVIEQPLNLNMHFILPSDQRSYDTLDAAMAFPQESEPWEPDNAVLSEEEREEGFIALFDGKTFDGWINTGSNPDAWAVVDGAIARVGDNGGVFQTVRKYDNFVLRFEWKIEPNGNSGVFLHMPRSGRQSKIGVEFQCLDEGKNEAHKNSAGAIYDVVAPLVHAANPAGEWNSVEVTFTGPLYRATMNGRLVQDLDFTEHPELEVRIPNGFIGLQDHNNYVEFRNIRIKPLAAE